MYACNLSPGKEAIDGFLGFLTGWKSQIGKLQVCEKPCLKERKKKRRKEREDSMQGMTPALCPLVHTLGEREGKRERVLIY